MKLFVKLNFYFQFANAKPIESDNMVLLKVSIGKPKKILISFIINFKISHSLQMIRVIMVLNLADTA